MNTTIGKGIIVTGTIHAERGGHDRRNGQGRRAGIRLRRHRRVGRARGRRGHGDARITVRGRSSGRLIAREVVRVQQSAAVRADVRSPRLALEDGATFNGQVEPAKTDAAILVAAYRNRGDASKTA